MSRRRPWRRCATAARPVPVRPAVRAPATARLRRSTRWGWRLSWLEGQPKDRARAAFGRGRKVYVRRRAVQSGEALAHLRHAEALAAGRRFARSDAGVGYFQHQLLAFAACADVDSPAF